MKMQLKQILIGSLIALAATAAQAQSTYKLLVDTPDFHLAAGDGAASYSAPRYSLFQILSDDTESLIVRFRKIAAAQNRAFVGSSGVVTTGVDYKIAKTSLLSRDYRLEYGFDYGVLTVPFKLQFKDKSLTAGASVGPHIGFRQRWLGGASSTILVSAGLSIIPVSDVNAANVDTKTGLTMATGIVFQPTQQFQIGAIVGTDHLGGPAGKAYKYEDHAWVSFSIGFGFAK